MEQSKINANQITGVWTPDNLAAGTNISIEKYVNPNKLSADTVGCWHMDSNKKGIVGADLTGNFAISTTYSKFGGGCGYMSDGMITLPNSILPTASSDFTVDFWFRYIASGSNTSDLWFNNTFHKGTGFHLYLNSSHSIYKVNIHTGYNSYVTTELQTAINASSSFIHIAFQKKGTSLELYIGGNLTATATFASTTYTSWGFSGNQYCHYIDELRFTKSAVYNGNFTPPTEPYSTGTEPDVYLVNNTFNTKATTSDLGLVKVDGTTITAAADGTISSVGGSLNNLAVGPGLKLFQGTPSSLTVTDFSSGSIKIPWQNPTTSMELVIHARTPSTYGASINNALFEADLGINAQIYGTGSNNTHIKIWMSSQGQSNNIASAVQVSPIFDINTDFWWKLIWDGSTYSFLWKTTSNWAQQTTITSSLAVYSAEDFLSLGRFFSADRTDNWRTGYIYLCDCSLKIDGNVLFDGANATSNDYDVIGTPIITGTNADPNSGKVTIMLE